MSLPRIPSLFRIMGRLRGKNSDLAFVHSREIIFQSGMFDRKYYLSQNHDVAESGVDPLEHYLLHGAMEGRNPSAEFDTGYYLRSNPDVARAGLNPLAHFVEFGKAEGRPSQKKADDVRQSADGAVSREQISGADDKPDEEWHPLLDVQHYSESYPEVVRAGMNPGAHYDRWGWKELRNPSPHFNTGWYWVVQMLPGRIVGNPLAHYVREGVAAGLDVRNATGLSNSDKQKMVEICQEALGDQTLSADVLALVGQVLMTLSHWADAESAFRRVVLSRWSDAKLHARIAQAVAKQGRWWQAIESMNTAIALDGTHASWFQLLGEASERMDRFREAADAYRRSIEIHGWAQAETWYRLGFCHLKNGQVDAAQRAYKKAIDSDRKLNSGKYGIGAFHQARGYWPEAADAYGRDLALRPAFADLAYKHAMALDRCYKWPEALAAYKWAIACDPRRAYWHYRMGFVLERLCRWAEAGEAYSIAATLSDKPVPYWRYRQGYVLQQCGQFTAACHAYLLTSEKQTIWGEALVADSDESLESLKLQKGETGLARSSEDDGFLESYLAKLEISEMVGRIAPQNHVDAELHLLQASSFERARMWDKAADAYREVVARTDKHVPDHYYRLGFVLFCAGRHAEACEAFRETRILRRPYGVDITHYQKTAQQKALVEYNEYLSELPISDHVIVYESYNGAIIGGNSYAIFRRLVEMEEYREWRHVWVIKDRNSVPVGMRAMQNVVLVTRGSDLYRRYLATASHLINDVTFPSWFIRREGQRYLNTWHGTPLKCLGKDIPGEFMAHKNIARNFLHATHVISPNAHTTRVMTECQDIHGISRATVAETGYPRVDRTLLMPDDEKQALRRQLGLNKSGPVVLYAPTWRGLHGSAEIDTEQLVGDLAALADCGCQVVFRGHQMLEDKVAVLDLPVVMASQKIDTSDILAITDILITDYSSIFFDFLPLNRPILYYVYDLAEYKQARGLYFDMHEMPGEVCSSRTELVNALVSQIRQPHCDEGAYARARSRFCPMEDGQATARAIEFFFNDSDQWNVPEISSDRTPVLFFAGLLPSNGITASFTNLVDGLEAEGRVEVAVVIDPDRITEDQQRVDNLAELPKSTRLIARVGSMLLSPEEAWINQALTARRDLCTPEMWRILENAYRREYRRIFGGARFQAVVNFEGYSLFWTKVLAFSPSDTRNLVYMHSDMMSECEVRHPYLQQMFRVYSGYDSLVSVSEKMCEVNSSRLSSHFGLDQKKFAWCPNVVDVPHIAHSASEPLDEDIAAWLGDRKTFLALGRLSPEKDHAKLIRAFAALHEKNRDACLLIVGDGPLRHELEIQIASAGLNDVVLLAGQRRNPFPALSRCDCFVMPSNHEGQPMVLLEAMVLGKSIIATDIDGNRGVLKDGYGHLTENSVEGLRQGMELFLSGGLEPKPFDSTGYEIEALAAFHRVIDGGSRAVGKRDPLGSPVSD